MFSFICVPILVRVFAPCRLQFNALCGIYGGRGAVSHWPLSINWVNRIRITTIFILYNNNYIDILYTTYIFRIM